MNVRFVVNQVGLLLVILATAMLLIAGLFFAVSGALHHHVDMAAGFALLVAGAAGEVVGGGLWAATRRCTRHLGRREALLLVALSWMLGAVFSALPFFLWAIFSQRIDAEHPFHRFDACYFEAMSGLTTTGATVLSDIEAVPRSLLLWRAMTHWFGGLGIVVLFVAVLPTLGVGGKKLFRVEAPGPAPEGLQPQIRDTARVLLGIYFGLTVAEWLALWWVGGMTPFDAWCHTAATLATGGFSTHNASVGAFHGPPYRTTAVYAIVILFMILAGANFGLYYQLWRRRLATVRKDLELRVYLILLLIGSAIVFVSVANQPTVVMTDGREVQTTTGVALAEAAFTTVSVQTTTGFCTSDFDRWPFAANGVLILLMFVGGCAGSTAGGIKVIRVWIALRVMLSEIERVFRPKVIRPVRIGGGTIDEGLKLATLAYVLGIIILFVVGAGAIMLLEQAAGSGCTFTTAATASIATLCTIGPGLDQVGAVQNYGWFTGASKIVMCVLMMLGRLEIFAIIVLFNPRFWRAD